MYAIFDTALQLFNDMYTCITTCTCINTPCKQSKLPTVVRSSASVMRI